MKAIIFLALLFLLPLSSAITIQDNSQNVDSDSNGQIGLINSGWDAGQYFQAQSSYTLKQVSVYQWDSAGANNSFDYEVDIYRTNASGSPIFLLASNFTYTQNDFLNGDSFPRWRNISFSDVQINAGEYYGIFFFELETNTETGLNWWHDDNNDTYFEGNAVVNSGVGSETNGSWWQSHDTSFTYFYDYSFIVWGEEIQQQPQSESFIVMILRSFGTGIGILFHVITMPLVAFILGVSIIIIIIVFIENLVAHIISKIGK
jgi:hypothetical protein